MLGVAGRRHTRLGNARPWPCTTAKTTGVTTNDRENPTPVVPWKTRCPWNWFGDNPWYTRVETSACDPQVCHHNNVCYHLSVPCAQCGQTFGKQWRCSAPTSPPADCRGPCIPQAVRNTHPTPCTIRRGPRGQQGNRGRRRFIQDLKEPLMPSLYHEVPVGALAQGHKGQQKGKRVPDIIRQLWGGGIPHQVNTAKAEHTGDRQTFQKGAALDHVGPPLCATTSTVSLFVKRVVVGQCLTAEKRRLTVGGSRWASPWIQWYCHKMRCLTKDGRSTRRSLGKGGGGIREGSRMLNLAMRGQDYSEGWSSCGIPSPRRSGGVHVRAIR